MLPCDSAASEKRAEFLEFHLWIIATDTGSVQNFIKEINRLFWARHLGIYTNRQPVLASRIQGKQAAYSVGLSPITVQL